MDSKEMLLVWLYKHEQAELSGREIPPYSISVQLGINDIELETELLNLKLDGMVDNGSVVKSPNGFEGVVKNIMITDIGREKAKTLFNNLTEEHTNGKIN